MEVLQNSASKKKFCIRKNDVKIIQTSTLLVLHCLSLHTSVWRKNKLKDNKKDSLWKPVAVMCMQIFKTVFKSLNNNTPKTYRIQTTNTSLILSLKYSWTLQGSLRINLSKKMCHTYLFTEITAAKNDALSKNEW